VLELTATSAATFLNQQAFAVEQAFALANIPVGAVLDGGAEISIDPGATGLTGATSFVRYVGGSVGFVIHYDMFPDANGAHGTIDGGFSYTARSKPLTISETPTQGGWFFRAYFGGAGNATIRIIPRARKQG
jgi:hypothetical protein